MSTRKPYRKKSEFYVTAVQIDMELESFNYTKWGGKQSCKAGDWLVNNNGEVYTVEKNYFAIHYQQVSPGVFNKIGQVWAEEASEDGILNTIEGKSEYSTGDYLVFDRKKGGQGYPVKKAQFELMYELLESQLVLTEKEQMYIDNRVKYLINWYEQRAKQNQIKFYCAQTITILSASLVPVVSVIPLQLFDLNWVIAALGATSAVTAALLGVYNWHTNWTKSRLASEKLKAHLSQFDIQRGIYANTKDAFEEFVENAEHIIATEVGEWEQRISAVAAKANIKEKT